MADLFMLAAGSAKQADDAKVSRGRQGSAFITTRKGSCYLTIKYGRCNVHIMRVRAYTIDTEDKRHMRRLYPEVDFDWKKITRQLTEKREVCRCYRSRRRASDTALRPRGRPSFCGLYEPSTRTIYVDGLPTNARAAGALLDAVLHIDRTLTNAAPSEPLGGVASETKPHLEPAKDSGPSECSRRRDSDDFEAGGMNASRAR
jgi:hypothetical protein